MRSTKNPNYIDGPLTIRKPQFQVGAGPEFAPTRPRDLNFVGSSFVKLPLVFTFHRQPSAVTIFPVVGIEGGRVIDSHLTGVDGSIVRGVAGGDASFRWPFDVTHNFFGDKPITIDYSYRMRWLSGSEPTTDIENGGLELTSHRNQSYMRGSLNAPLSANFQFKLTVQHGGLPPDFHRVGYSLNLGFTFTTSVGTSAH